MTTQQNNDEKMERVLNSISQLRRIIKRSEKIVWSDKIKDRGNQHKVMQMNRKAKRIMRKANAINKKIK